MSGNFEPKIIAFVCHWCTFAAADLAGVSRLQYPANVRLVRIPCTGRLDPALILRAFRQGADGVLVSGCHPGDCHYTSGNLNARRRFILFNHFMRYVGMDPDRLHFAWISSAEGGKFAETVKTVVEKVRALGPMKQFVTDEVEIE